MPNEDELLPPYSDADIKFTLWLYEEFGDYEPVNCHPHPWDDE